MINWQLSRQGIRWPVSPERIAGSGVDPSRSSIFLKLSADKVPVFKWLQAQVYFFLNSYEICCVLYVPHNYNFDFKLTSEAKIQLVFTGREDMPVAFDFSHQGHALVTLYVQLLCSDWSKLDRWVLAENLCSILKLVYFDSWSWQSFVSTCDFFNCLFPLNVQNEIQLLSRVFCYLWLVCSLGFGWEIRRLSKSEIRFRMASLSFFTLLDA